MVTSLRKKPTKLFLGYLAQMVFRLLLFAVGVAALLLQPSQLSPTMSFGLEGGFNFVDLIFLVVLADILTKFFPHAKISMGSLKQYGEFHVPTLGMFQGGRDAVVAYVRSMIAQGRIVAECIPKRFPAQVRVAFDETVEGARDSLRVLLRSIDFLRLVPFGESQLTVDEPVRDQIRRDRLRETMPTLFAWILFNLILFAFLRFLGLVGVSAVHQEQVVVVWMLFYFLFDMICVVLWCPIQLLIMRNRCCTTCQIFNWDAIMAVTPLVLMVGSEGCRWFAWPLLLLAFIVLIRWELAFARHPERFDERTNASLSCAHCTDKLCYIREPLFRQLPEIPGLPSPQASDGAAHMPKGDLRGL